MAISVPVGQQLFWMMSTIEGKKVVEISQKSVFKKCCLEPNSWLTDD
jgi:hypothetical protein